MNRSFCLLAAVTLSFGLTACALPRGAALSSEVLREQDNKDADFQVVAVSRANVARLADWPVTGNAGLAGWPKRSSGSSNPVIRAGDTLDLSIWDSQENSLLTGGDQKMVQLPGMVVSGNGSIFLPYIGQVKVSGLTPSDARAKLQTAMAQAAPAAQVQLSYKAGGQNSVDVVTGVAKPGSYDLVDRNQTILSTLSQAGGVATGLRNPVVRLIRGSETHEIWLRNLLDNGANNILTMGGDKVIIEQDERYFTALGAASAEKIVYFDQPRITGLEAMSMMGGLTDTRANPEGVLVLREFPSKALRGDEAGPQKTQVVFTFDLTTADGLFAARQFQINPLDTVLATESPVVAAQTVTTLFGSLLGLAQRLN